MIKLMIAAGSRNINDVKMRMQKGKPSFPFVAGKIFVTEKIHQLNKAIPKPIVKKKFMKNSSPDNMDPKTP